MASDPIRISDQLVSALLKKGGQAKDATDACYRIFTNLKSVLYQFERKLTEQNSDPRLKVKYTDRGQFEAELKVADDVIIFIMHTNAFVFDPSHSMWKSGYLSMNGSRGTCGMISIYNFLSDSFKFDRRNDTGLLVGRIFINGEENFYVEGKRQLGILFNDFATQKASDAKLLEIVEAAVLYSLDIDVNVPAYEAMKEISVHEVLTYNMQTAVNAGKRLGFKFQNEQPDVE
jgi:hypothetical protein